MIEPIGIITVEFLMKHYDRLFSYEYTKTMEMELDLISSGEVTDQSEICKQCYNEITDLSKPVENISKQTYKIDETHIFTFDKYGPVIRKTIDNSDKIQFISVRKDINIDIAKLIVGDYTLEDLVEKKEKIIGTIENQPVILKNGRYGIYIEIGERHISIKPNNKPFDEIEYDDIKDLINQPENKKEEDKNVLRKLNDEMSVRKGKFGAYVYYKRDNMKSPKFLNIKKFPEGYLGCEPSVLIDWLCKTYKLSQS